MDFSKILSLFQFESKRKNSKQQEFLQSYHYQRGIELHNQGRDGDAFEEFKLELNEHPENGMAHLMIADIHYQHNVMGTALQAANNAIKLLQETANNDYLSQIYYIRGEIYRALNESDNWQSDILKSLEYNPDSVDALGELGDFYYFRNEYDKSDIQFNKIINLQPHNPYGYMGRGRNDQGRNEHKAAIAHFERAAQLDSDYSPAHSFMAESLLALNKKSDAIDSIIAAISISEQDRKARDMMMRIANADMQGLCLKIKAKAIQHQDNDSWYRLLGWVCAGQGDMKEAILAYHKAYIISASTELLGYKAFCWSKMGVYDKAIEDIKLAIEKDPQNIDFKEKLAIYHAESGLLNEAIADVTSIIEEQPDNHLFYFNRGRFLFELDKYDDAIKDFDTALSLKDSLALPLLYKGWALSEMGKEEEATKVWQSIIEKEDLFEDTDYTIPLALYFLDYNDESETKCKACIAQKEKEEYYHYDGDLYLYAAALFCRTGNKPLAIEHLKKSIDSCNCRLWYMNNGKLLKPLRNEQEFNNFISDIEHQITKNKEEVLAVLSKLSNNNLNNIKAEIPFVREGKMCKVKCEVNGLPLHFIFDTGASDVTMSSVEATFMLKNGYLNESDLSGKQYYRTADGSIAEGVKVRLHNVGFAGLSLSNVKAGIVTNQSAPLLLGQSVLERLGRIEIDNDKMLIKINS